MATGLGLTHSLRNGADPPQPLGGFATTLVASLIVFAVLYSLAFLAEMAYIGTLEDYLRGDATAAEVEEMQTASGGLQFLAGLVSLVVAGFFIAWMYRAYKNLIRTSVAELRYKPGWAIGAWFIPVFSWIRPKQMINDIWRAGEAGAEVRDGSWRRRPVSQLLHWWWGVWVTAAIVGIVAAIVGFDPDLELSGRAEFEREQEAATIAAPGILCTVAAAVLACIVIRRITQRDDELRSAVLAATPIPSSRPPDDALVATGSNVRCAICGWVFTDPESAREHLATHHPGQAESPPP